MTKIVVVNNVSLDGVMQAPARPDEDRRDGFAHGGWAVAGGDEVMGRRLGEAMVRRGALLLGRRTYEDFYAVWPNAPQPNPFTERLNNTRKYVVSNTLSEPLPWVNSTLVSGDGADAVARLKRDLPSGDDLCVLGSGALLHSLIPRGLIDEYLLLIHPVLLGAGLRLFPDGAYAPLKLAESITTTTGVVIATYRSEDAQTPA
jgi:dihydrofolate reductase